MIDKEMMEAISQMMDAKLEPINTRLTGLEEEQRHTRVLMEHMDKRMDALADGQANMNKKFKILDGFGRTRGGYSDHGRRHGSRHKTELYGHQKTSRH